MFIAMSESAVCAHHTAIKFAGLPSRNDAGTVATPSSVWLFEKLRPVTLSKIQDTCNVILNHVAKPATFAVGTLCCAGKALILVID